MFRYDITTQAMKMKSPTFDNLNGVGRWFKRQPSLVDRIGFVGDLAGHVRREHKSPVPRSTEWVSSYAVVPNPH